MLLSAAEGSGSGGNQLSHAVVIPHDGQQQGDWGRAARTSLKTGDSLTKESGLVLDRSVTPVIRLE